jgi:cytochrome bd-type quinol oxidase subunit 1
MTYTGPLSDSHNYFSNVVRPAEIKAETARHQMEKLQEAANVAKSQLYKFALMTEGFAKEQEDQDMSLVTVVQEQVDEIARITAKRDVEIEQALAWFNPRIARKQEEAVKAGKRVDEYEKKVDSAQTTFAGAARQLDDASAKYSTAERFKKVVQENWESRWR